MICSQTKVWSHKCNNEKAQCFPLKCVLEVEKGQKWKYLKITIHTFCINLIPFHFFNRIKVSKKQNKEIWA